jgi:hypothetical protein
LEDILRENIPDNQKIHFMSIDCEGHDEKILHSNNWSKFRPMMLMVEEHGEEAKESVLEYLYNQGYGYYGRSGLTLFFFDKEA